jgi:calcineurin-like phosphoesterase
MMLLKLQKSFSKKLILKQNVDFMVVDFHGEITSEKMAIGHFFDGLSTLCSWNSYSCTDRQILVF